MKKLVIFSILFSVVVFGGLGIAPIKAADKATDHCDTPTAQLTVIASNADGDFVFDKKEYNVERATCYTLTFENAGVVGHDMTIDADGNDFKLVHLALDSSTDNNGSISMNILTPDKDVTYKIYCSVTGHADAGMTAKLIVGAGSKDSSAPGFSWVIALAAFVLPVMILRKRR